MYRQHSSNEIGARKGLSAVKSRLSRIRSGWYSKQVFVAYQIAVKASLDQISGRPKKVLFGASTLRMRKAIFVLKCGRRRFSDRIILFFSAWMGWL